MDDLYDKIILKHANFPQYFGTEEDLKLDFIEADNPLCGDSFKIKLKWGEGGVLLEGIFFGYGCSISKASGSILLSKIIGKDKAAILEILKTLKEVIEGDGDLNDRIDKEILAFKGARKYPSRKSCAKLIPGAIQDAYF